MGEEQNFKAEEAAAKMAENMLSGASDEYLIVYSSKDGSYRMSCSNLTWALGACERAKLDLIASANERRAQDEEAS